MTTKFFKTPIFLLSLTQFQGNPNWATELSIKRVFMMIVHAPALQDPRLWITSMGISFMGFRFPRNTHTPPNCSPALAPGRFAADRCRDAAFCLARSYFWELSPNKSSHLIFSCEVWWKCDAATNSHWDSRTAEPGVSEMLGIEVDSEFTLQCPTLRMLLFMCLSTTSFPVWQNWSSFDPTAFQMDP